MLDTMDKQQLIQAASGLSPAGGDCARAFAAAGPAMGREVTRDLEAGGPLSELIGEGNREVMETNHGNHAAYMASILEMFDPAAFVETLHWVVRAYTARGFAREYFVKAMNAWVRAAGRYLDADCARAVAPFYDYILDHIDDLLALAESEPSAFETGHPGGKP